MEFIPANESKLFITVFRQYVWWLFRRKFNAVYVRQDYIPTSSSRSMYYGNHNSWWDGLIPLLLNEFILKQQARAIMEDKQMKKYPFFKWIGAFSVDRENSRRAIYTLRYALQTMKRDNAALYLYPEGTIVPFIRSLQPSYEGGLTWLAAKLNNLDVDVDVDVVPMHIYINTYNSHKPELLIWLSNPVQIPDKQPNEVIKAQLSATSGCRLRSMCSILDPAEEGYRALW